MVDRKQRLHTDHRSPCSSCWCRPCWVTTRPELRRLVREACRHGVSARPAPSCCLHNAAHLRHPVWRPGRPVVAAGAGCCARASSRRNVAAAAEQREQARRRGAGLDAVAPVDSLRGCVPPPRAGMCAGRPPVRALTTWPGGCAGVVIAGSFYLRWGAWGYLNYCVACALPYILVPLLSPAAADKVRRTCVGRSCGGADTLLPLPLSRARRCRGTSATW